MKHFYEYLCKQLSGHLYEHNDALQLAVIVSRCGAATRKVFVKVIVNQSDRNGLRKGGRKGVRGRCSSRCLTQSCTDI